MSACEIAARFREQRYTSADSRAVVKALENCDAAFLSVVTASYIKYADNIDKRALVGYLKVAEDFWPVHEIISGLSTLRCKECEFTTEVLRYAQGVSWDQEGYAQIAAIAAIPRVLCDDPRVQKVLEAAVRSSNVVVRDTALEAAQMCLGVPSSEIKRGLSYEDLVHHVSQEIREWLGIRS